MNLLEWPQHFSHYKYMGIFFIRSRAANSAALDPIWPKFELCPDLLVVLVPSKNEEDPIKDEGARAATRYVDFSGPQWWDLAEI